VKRIYVFDDATGLEILVRLSGPGEVVVTSSAERPYVDGPTSELRASRPSSSRRPSVRPS